MSSKVIWQGSTSPILYIYEFLGVFVLSLIFQKYVGGYVFLWALPVSLYLYFKARSMKYIFSDTEIYFSPSIGDEETMIVKLEEIKAIQIVDRQPWKFLRLGTILFITNPDEDWAPCMKSIKEPHRLANLVRSRAQALGATHITIETI